MEENHRTSKAFLLFLAALLITIIGGTLTGIAVAVIGSLFYLVFLFPLGMGFIGGNIAKLGIRLAKIRKMGEAVLLSILVAISIYGTYHYAKYIFFQGQMFVQLLPKLTKVSQENKIDAAKVLMDYALIKETGHSGFVGYMLYKAQQGVSLGRFYSSNPLSLGPVLTWMYWLLEFGIILWVTTSIAKKDAQVPVCEVCGSRLGTEKHLGGTTPANESLMLDLIHRKEFSELGKLIEKTADVPSTELYIRRCEACQKGTSHLMVRRAFQTTKGTVQFSDILNVTLAPTDGLLLSQELRSHN
jgi:cation transporter-like permease